MSVRDVKLGDLRRFEEGALGSGDGLVRTYQYNRTDDTARELTWRITQDGVPREIGAKWARLVEIGKWKSARP
jgi:hypothetical protein